MDSSCAAPPADCARACVKPLRRIFLQDGALTVGVAPDCGGALTRFDVRVGETLVDILRQAIDGTQRSVCALGTACFPLVPYGGRLRDGRLDRKSTRLNSSHSQNSYAVFCLKKKKINSRQSQRVRARLL